MQNQITRYTRVILFIALTLFFFAFFYWDLGQYFSLDYLQSSKQIFQSYYQLSPVLTILLYFVLYVLVTTLSFPGATVLTLAGGFLFGLGWGLVIVSFASTMGASLAFLISRFLFRKQIQKHFSERLKTINEGIKKDGAFYLFSLRLIPLFPFFVINLVMGLTPLPLRTYYWVSQLGMLPGTLIYVNAGTQLSEVNELSDILSPALVLSFLAIGLTPWFGKIVFSLVEHRRIYKGFKKPQKFDFNLIVIGAGSGGLVSALIAANLKAKVALIEKNKMGGDCLNTGCVPSKALIKAAKVAHILKTADQYGFSNPQFELNFSAVMSKVHDAIKKIEPHDSVERYTSLGVKCLSGEARFISPWEVDVQGQNYSAKNIIIATGASPNIPKLKGIDKVSVLTSENIWNLTTLPPRLAILGGGPIGCEMAQAFQRLGSEVTLVQSSSRLMNKEDEEVSAFIRRKLESEGVKVYTDCKATEIKTTEDKKLVCETSQGSLELSFDEILVAVGRKPRTQGFGLEKLEISLTEQGTIRHNEFMQTNFPNIFVCGDVAGPHQFTHVASHQAYYASLNSLFGGFFSWLPSTWKAPLKLDDSMIPWATFTDPEVATLGLNERAALKAGVSYEITRYGMHELDRAIADGEAEGFIKVLTVPGKDVILGATLIGPRASDMAAEFISAIKAKKGLNHILGTIHIYPTHSEANKYAAGVWKKSHKPEKLLNKMERFFKWQRS